MASAQAKGRGKDLTGRFAAWWDGRDYVPPEPGEPANDADAVETDLRSVAPEAETKAALASPRLRALHALWGDGRLGPASPELSERMTRAFSFGATHSPPALGLVGCDPATVIGMMSSLGAAPVISEWRDDCAALHRAANPDFDVFAADPDRPGFEDGSLDGLFTLEAMTFADHKLGLASRLLKALKPGATWVAMDYACDGGGDLLKPAFASAFAEAQLLGSDDLVAHAETAGFETMDPGDDISGDWSGAARDAFRRLEDNLENAIAPAMGDGADPAFLREFAWEAESWKWRMRALGSGLLEGRIQVFQKPDTGSSTDG